MRLNRAEIQWISNQHNAGRTPEEIAIDTGMSTQNVKRALAESGDIYLTWYKTKDENQMLNTLRNMGIYNNQMLLNSIKGD